MNDESSMQTLDKEGPTRYLTDATIMGSTPRLNLQKVFDDPYLIKAKEKRIISLADQITQLSRENSNEVYKLTLKRRLLNLRAHELKRKETRLKRRETKASTTESNLQDVSTLQNRSESKKKQAKINFEKTKSSYEEVLNTYDNYLKSENDFVTDMDTSELESLIPDNIQDGEQRAEMEERIYIIMQIKDKLKTISKLKQNLRNAKLKEIVHDTEIAEINCTKNSLKIKVNELQERLAKANQRFDVASKKKANPYDPVHFEEGIIEKIEQSADDSEKRLNRSRVDAIEYELQHEFSSYQALKDENKKRTEALQAKRLEIQKMKQRQQQRSKIISKMTPRKRDDHTETQIRSPASSVMTPEKRSNLNQKKQSALDKFNQEVDELEKANKEARLKTEKEYYEVMAHLQTLTRESHKNDETFVKMCNLSTQVDKLRLEESEVAQQLAKLTNSRAILTHKLKTMKGKEQYADKVAELDAIKLTIQAKEKDLSLMREKVAQQRAAVEGLQSNVDDYESRRNEIEKQIAELNKHITDSVETIVDYSQYMNSIHLAVFNQPGKEEEEEQVIEEKQNEEEEEEAQLNEEEEEAQLDNESNPNEFMEEENKTESVNEDIQEEDNLPEEENVHELEEENVPEVEEELQENIPIAEEEKMIDGNENVIDGEQQFNDEEENKASKIKL